LLKKKLNFLIIKTHADTIGYVRVWRIDFNWSRNFNRFFTFFLRSCTAPHTFCRFYWRHVENFFLSPLWQFRPPSCTIKVPLQRWILT
jgi:hypothetical protein